MTLITTDNPRRCDADAPIRAAVLCVQPVREHRKALVDALSRYSLTFVETGLDAVRTLNAGVFDAYVLDYWLSDWSGLSLCRQIRKTDPHGPILFFSSAEGEDQRKRAGRAGATEYLLASDGARVFDRALEQALARARFADTQAQIEEERAIQEELQRRAALAIEASMLARARSSAAMQAAARARAHHEFLEAGGTVAGFERLWTQVYASMVGPDDGSDACPS